jgi:hypothetical protein
MKMKAAGGAILIALCAPLAGCGGGSGHALPSTAITPSPAPHVSAAPSNVSVDDTSVHGRLNMAVGAQLDDYTFPASVPGGLSYLSALTPAWFRIHAGSDMDPAVLPEPQAVPDSPQSAASAPYDFTEIDNLVSTAYQSGGTPVLNVRYAPRSMWTCAAYFTGQAGTLSDPSFSAFGDYMARLVSYYNAGSMTDGAITRVNPFGTAHAIHYWELWNEPDLTNEDPCIAAGWGPALTSAQYMSMWNVVTGKMLAVDPTIHFVGPTVSYSTTPQTPDYIPSVLQAPNQPLVISAHAYGGTQTMTDDVLLNGDGSGYVGVPGIVNAVSAAQTFTASAGKALTPVWIDEMNLEYDWGDDPTQRPWTAFGAAFDATIYARMAEMSAANGAPLVLFPFEYSSAGYEQSQIDPNNGTRLLNYWTYFQISRCVKSGAVLLHSGATDSNVESFAVRNIDGGVCVMVMNAQPASPTDIGGRGVARSVTVTESGMPAVSSNSVTVLDAQSPLATGPKTNASTGTSATVSFAGYGVAFVRFAP